VDTIFPRLIAAGRHHATLAVSTYEQRLTLQRRVVDALDGHKKGVKVKMGDIALGLIRRHLAKIRVFLFTGCLSVVIALLTVGSQAIAAARTNPAKNLRPE